MIRLVLPLLIDLARDPTCPRTEWRGAESGIWRVLHHLHLGCPSLRVGRRVFGRTDLERSVASGIVNVEIVAIVRIVIGSVSVPTAVTVVIETVSASTAAREIVVIEETVSVRIGIEHIAASVQWWTSEEAIALPENARGATAQRPHALPPAVDPPTVVEEFSTARAANTISNPRR